MQNQNIQYRRIVLLIALVLGCFALSPALKADDHGDSAPIVGLWHVHYFHGAVEWNQTYDQWHSDGLEIETPAFLPPAISPQGVCMGTWKRLPHGIIQLFHVAWTYNAAGMSTGHWEEMQTDTVSHDHRSYQGTYDIKFYDLSGTFLFEDTGTVTAERLPEEY